MRCSEPRTVPMLHRLAPAPMRRSHSSRLQSRQIKDRCCLSWMPFDLEAEQFLFRVVRRIVFHKPVLHGRIDAVARDGQGFSIGAYVEHVVVECIRTVEVSGLAQSVSVRITQAPDILQAMVAGQTDGFEIRGDLSVGNAVREFLYQREAMV